jgi:hypothetical protein
MDQFQQNSFIILPLILIENHLYIFSDNNNTYSVSAYYYYVGYVSVSVNGDIFFV